MNVGTNFIGARHNISPIRDWLPNMQSLHLLASNVFSLTVLCLFGLGFILTDVSQIPENWKVLESDFSWCILQLDLSKELYMRRFDKWISLKFKRKQRIIYSLFSSFVSKQKRVCSPKQCIRCESENTVHAVHGCS